MTLSPEPAASMAAWAPSAARARRQQAVSAGRAWEEASEPEAVAAASLAEARMPKVWALPRAVARAAAELGARLDAVFQVRQLRPPEAALLGPGAEVRRLAEKS